MPSFQPMPLTGVIDESAARATPGTARGRLAARSNSRAGRAGCDVAALRVDVDEQDGLAIETEVRVASPANVRRNSPPRRRARARAPPARPTSGPPSDRAVAGDAAALLLDRVVRSDAAGAQRRRDAEEHGRRDRDRAR